MNSRQKNRLHGWLLLAAVIAVMDCATYLTSPRDAWNPLHPRAPHWIDPSKVYAP